MPYGRRTKLAVEPSLDPQGGSIQRLSSQPWEDEPASTKPSEAVKSTLAENEQRIWQLSHYSALRAMPVILATGEQTTIAQQEQQLRDTVAELVRRAIDDGHGHAQDNCGIFSIEVMIARRDGETYSDRTKNLYVLEADISVPLEFASIECSKAHYSKLKKVAQKWFD